MGLLCFLLMFANWSFKVFKDYRIVILGSIAGLSNTIANVCIILAIKLNLKSGGSPGAMNWILMFNVVVLLIVGVFMFKEHHTLKQYVGGVIIFIAIIILALSRSFEETGTHTTVQNNQYIISLWLAFVSWNCWAIPGIAGKYAIIHYNCGSIDFSNLALFISGISGAAIYFYIYAYQVPFGLIEPEKAYLAIIKSVLWGVFSVLGYLLFYKATSIGPVEISQLFSNLKSIVQIIEEFIFLGILPNLISCFSIILACLGLILVVFWGEDKHKELSDDSANSFVKRKC